MVEPAERRRSRWIYALLLLPFIGTLWVPFYNSTEPTLGGFPFFYWYQFLWIPIGAALTRRAERAWLSGPGVGATSGVAGSEPAGGSLVDASSPALSGHTARPHAGRAAMLKIGISACFSLNFSTRTVR